MPGGKQRDRARNVSFPDADPRTKRESRGERRKARRRSAKAAGQKEGAKSSVNKDPAAELAMSRARSGTGQRRWQGRDSTGAGRSDVSAGVGRALARAPHIAAP